MYFENNRRAAENRADADFLRRMLGGELNGTAYERSYDHSYDRSDDRSGDRSGDRTRCDGTPIESRRNTTRTCCEWTPQTRQQQARQETPLMPEGGCGCHMPCNTSCPTEVHAPSLAMVYSPRQCWRKLLDPAEGLAQGTIFAELVLPFEAVPQKGGKEGCARRPM